MVTKRYLIGDNIAYFYRNIQWYMKILHSLFLYDNSMELAEIVLPPFYIWFQNGSK